MEPYYPYEKNDYFLIKFGLFILIFLILMVILLISFHHQYKTEPNLPKVDELIKKDPITDPEEKLKTKFVELKQVWQKNMGNEINEEISQITFIKMIRDKSELKKIATVNEKKILLYDPKEIHFINVPDEVAWYYHQLKAVMMKLELIYLDDYTIYATLTHEIEHMRTADQWKDVKTIKEMTFDEFKKSICLREFDPFKKEFILANGLSNGFLEEKIKNILKSKDFLIIKDIMIMPKQKEILLLYEMVAGHSPPTLNDYKLFRAMIVMELGMNFYQESMSQVNYLWTIYWPIYKEIWERNHPEKKK